MDQQFEELFTRFRPGPWRSDPNAVAQEGLPGNGNPDSMGWLSDGAVTADTIAANAITAEKIAAGTITGDKIATNTIEAGHIAAGAVDTGELAAGAVVAEKIAAGTITGDKIAVNTITAGNIAANAVTADKIAANAVTADKIAANSVTAAKIASNTITASEIAANAITASELASNSVQTVHIVAGNVTSSKLELVVSGKRFGANDGSTDAPGLYFDSDGDTGMIRIAPYIVLVNDGGTSFFTSSTAVRSARDLYPATDNFHSLGLSTHRWTEVWAVDGTINTSDERLKRDIIDSPLGLDFIRNLRPVAYRWRDTPDTQAREAVALDEAALAEECRPHEERIREIRGAQAAGTIDDADAEAEVNVLREEIAAITERHVGPVREALAKRRPGQRQHYGLIAQEVKQVLDDLGVDAAFWKETREGEQALAYTELIAPLIKAVQELADRVDALEDQLKNA